MRAAKRLKMVKDNPADVDIVFVNQEEDWELFDAAANLAQHGPIHILSNRECRAVAVQKDNSPYPKVVGSLWDAVNHATSEGQEEYTFDIDVDMKLDPARRHGVFKRLAHAAIDTFNELRNGPYPELRYNIYVIHPYAMKLLERLGFEVEDVIKRDDVVGDAWFMTKYNPAVQDNPFYLSVQEDDGEIESFGPMSTVKLALDDVQVEHVAEFVVDAEDYTWKRLGELLREERTAMEMTGRKLAKKIGMSPSYLSGIERGTERPRNLVLNSISSALGFRIEGTPSDDIDSPHITKAQKMTKKNPVTEQFRELLHSSDVRRLEKLEFEAVFYHDMADLLYLEGMDDLADEYSELADEALNYLESVSDEVILEAGGPLTGGEEENEGFGFDIQVFMVYAWAEHLLGQRAGPSMRGSLAAEVAHRSNLADYIRKVLKSEFRDFLPTTTDQELLEAAEDAYEAAIEYRLKQLTGLRGAAAPIYLPSVQL